MINSILEFSKIEAGSQNIKPDWVDVATLAHEIDPVFKMASAEKKLQINYRFENAQPLWADEVALKQILVNFISNAIKFSPVESEITVRGMSDDEEFVLEVEDHGVGIAEDQLESVLMPFHQEDTQYTRNVGGTGLGLSIVKGLVELHEGRLEIESQKEQGTTVRAIFPQRQSTPPRLKAVANE